MKSLKKLGNSMRIVPIIVMGRPRKPILEDDNRIIPIVVLGRPHETELTV